MRASCLDRESVVCRCSSSHGKTDVLFSDEDPSSVEVDEVFFRLADRTHLAGQSPSGEHVFEEHFPEVVCRLACVKFSWKVKHVGEA